MCRSRFPGSRILVALCDSAARIHVSAAFDSAGFGVLLARSAAQLVEILRSVELVVADAIMLAGVPPPGREALRVLPVLLLSGRSEVPRAVAAELGATAVFRAPFELEDVVTIALNATRWAASRSL